MQSEARLENIFEFELQNIKEIICQAKPGKINYRKIIQGSKILNFGASKLGVKIGVPLDQLVHNVLYILSWDC